MDFLDAQSKAQAACCQTRMLPTAFFSGEKSWLQMVSVQCLLKNMTPKSQRMYL